MDVSVLGGRQTTLNSKALLVVFVLLLFSIALARLLDVVYF